MKTVSLETIADGAIPELFQAELERVLLNMADINTDPEQKRTITISVTFETDAKREVAGVKVKCGSKLAGIMTVNSQVYMGIHNGKLVAVENNPKQPGFFDDDKQKPLAPVASFNRKDGE